MLGGLLKLLPDQLAPRRRRNRPGAVPDVRGLFYPVCLEVTTRYGLHVRIVRLTERPMAVDGLVVDQDPRPADEGVPGRQAHGAALAPVRAVMLSRAGADMPEIAKRLTGGQDSGGLVHSAGPVMTWMGLSGA